MKEDSWSLDLERDVVRNDTTNPLKDIPNLKSKAVYVSIIEWCLGSTWGTISTGQDQLWWKDPYC